VFVIGDIEASYQHAILSVNLQILLFLWTKTKISCR